VKWLWKFVFLDGETKYIRTFETCLNYMYTYEDYQFDVYYKDAKNNWNYAFTYRPEIRCKCGRLYTDTPNGERFAFRDNGFQNGNMQELIKILQIPAQCYYCYYEKEYRDGRFVPRAFRIDFEKKSLYNE